MKKLLYVLIGVLGALVAAYMASAAYISYNILSLVGV